MQVGRPVLHGLALDGQQGVEDVLNCLKRELALNMALAGAPCFGAGRCCPACKGILSNAVNLSLQAPSFSKLAPSLVLVMRICLSLSLILGCRPAHAEAHQQGPCHCPR